MKRIVISDTHIGSKYYKEKELLDFLKSVEYDQLILAGDILDFIRVPQFTARALEIAKVINFTKEIIYVVGNHETPLTGFIGKEIFGIKFVRNYKFEEEGRSFVVEHGDRYDDMGIIHNGVLMNFLSVAQNCIENWFDVNLSDWMTDWKFKKRKLRRIWDILIDNSEADVFICGHFHMPECVIWVQADQSIKTYVNSGDWVQHTTYVQINDSQVRLKEWKGGDTNNQIGS